MTVNKNVWGGPSFIPFPAARVQLCFPCCVGVVSVNQLESVSICVCALRRILAFVVCVFVSVCVCACVKIAIACAPKYKTKMISSDHLRFDGWFDVYMLCLKQIF
jgi:hypothetical protein